MLYKVVLASLAILCIFLFTYHDAEAQSVAVVGTNGYLNESGHYVVLGEVENVGSIPLHFTEVIVTFFDIDYEQLQELSVSVALGTIHPGQTSPFIVVLRDTHDSPIVSSYDVKVGTSTPTTYKEKKLSIIFHKSEIFEDNIIVSGRLANDGSSVSRNTRVMVVLYNFIGEPIRYSSVLTEPGDILPFGSATFSARVKIDNGIDISGYAISSESSNYRETERLLQVEETAMQRIPEVAKITDLITLDKNNKVTAIIDVEDPVLAQLNITNMLNERKQYTYILQVTDQNGFISSLSWSMGTLVPKQSDITTIAWVPQEPGGYMLEAFVWKSITDPLPLAFRTIVTNFQVR